MATPDGSPGDPPGSAVDTSGLIERWHLCQGLLPIEKKRVPIEIVAGITLAALAIPEVMGYATIAGMPVITGVYTILLPLLAYAIFGASRHLVVGADSATAAVLAAGIAGMAAAGSSDYVALAGFVALMAAALLLLARLIGLGFLADFLSRTVLVGFLTGVGIQVACGQVGGMLGIPEGSGLTIAGHDFDGTIAKLISTLEGIGDISWTTAAVSACVIVVLLGAKFVTTRIPGALIAVIGAIVVSWWWDLASHGVSTLGQVPSGLPSLSFPSVAWSDVPGLIGTAASIFVLILAQSAATSRAYAAKYNEAFDENVDLVGLSTANIAAGLTGTFVVNGSPTKTQMVDGAGGRSQLAQVTTAVIVAVVLLWLTVPLQYMPNAVLASVVFLIGVELVDIPGMRRIWSLRRSEFFVAALTAVVVIAVGVEQGVVVAIVASLIDHLRHSYRPPSGVLRRSEDDSTWQPVEFSPEARTEPGLAVYTFAGSLYYANASHFSDEVLELASGEEPPGWVCIDAVAIPDVDITGGETLGSLYEQLSARGVRLVFAGVAPEVSEELVAYGVWDQVGGADAFHPSVSAAVAACRDTRP